MNHRQKRSLFLHACHNKLDLYILLSSIVLADFRSNQVPNLSILPFLHQALLILIDIQKPVLISEELSFECAPLNFFVFVHNHVILFEFMTANDYGFILVLNTLAKLTIATKALYLMSLLTPMLSILNSLIMLLITLLST